MWMMAVNKMRLTGKMMFMESSLIEFPLPISLVFVAIAGSKYKSKIGGIHWYSFLKKPFGFPEDQETNTVIPAINKMEGSSAIAFIVSILTPLVAVIQGRISVSDEWNVFEIFTTGLFPFHFCLFNNGFIAEQVNTH